MTKAMLAVLLLLGSGCGTLEGEEPIPFADLGLDRVGEIRLLNVTAPQLGGGGNSSALVDIRYPGEGGAPLNFDNRDVFGNGCTLKMAEGAGQVAGSGTFVDQGAVHLEIGNQIPFPDCEYRDDVGYACVDRESPSFDNVTEAVGDNIERLSINDVGVFEQHHEGQYLLLKDQSGTSPEVNGLFPIVGVTGDSAVDYIDPFPSSTSSVAGLNVAVLVGLGATGFTPNEPFLSNGDIIVAKDRSPDGKFDAFDIPVEIGGDGFRLNSESRVEAFPLDQGPLPEGGAITFGCDADGECGPGTHFIVSGRTSDTFHDGQRGLFEMPPPQNSFVEFSCLSSEPTITLPAPVLEALQLVGRPQRLELTAARVQVTDVLNEDELSATRVMVGHGVVGWTDLGM